MVKQVIRSVRSGIPVIEVRASRGKVTRAEPIAALYEQNRVSHVGTFPELEDQMVLFTALGIEEDTTADRVDALVWAFAELFPKIIGSQGRKNSEMQEHGRRMIKRDFPQAGPDPARPQHVLIASRGIERADPTWDRSGHSARVTPAGSLSPFPLSP